MDSEEPVRLLLDRNRCEGHGLCEQAAPELIHLNDDAEPVFDVDEIPAARRSLAAAAVHACPVAALSLSTTKLAQQSPTPQRIPK